MVAYILALSIVFAFISCSDGSSGSSDDDSGQVTNPATPKVTYTVTFDANGGSGAMNPQIFTYGEPQNLSPNEFSMENKDFLGWAKTSGGSIAYDDNSGYTIGTADVTLYAVWGKLVTADNAATVIAGLEGGTWENSNVCTVKITSKELTDENILKEISKKIDSVFANPSYIHINLDLSAVEITEISESAFASAKLTGITLPNSLKSIEKNAFGATYHLKKIVIPDNVETIKTEAFIGSRLTEITLPASLSSIEEGAFFECDKLETVYYKGTQAQWVQIKIDDYNDKLTGAKIICSDGIINGE
ncbi:leucine-rich repeat protein [Treponema succinifaciens]|uniref:leucine-rich repeat protein n=1 Tax=Treponema succinifaciens TaxID=167 RepID=UPI0030B8B2EE